MVSRSLLTLWICSLTQACGAEEPPREQLLSWVRERLLGGLGLEEPPAASLQGLSRETPGSWPLPLTGSRTEPRPEREASQIFLFPSSASCSAPAETFSYRFQPSINRRRSLLTSAHFWFHTGGGVASNTSALLLLTSSGQRPLQVAAAPSERSSDGWSTFWLGQHLLPAVSAGPFLLQVLCPSCSCPSEEHTPFLHLQARPPTRSPRMVPFPWSPSALDLLQRPSPQRPLQGACQRAEAQISIQELGWDSWIVHPKALTFYYCQGNCSAGSSDLLDVPRCCAPVPGSMRSLHIITTSDGGDSFKYETLPNIIPEECTCF